MPFLVIITTYSGVYNCRSNKISMDGKERVLDNVFVERSWRTLKHEDICIKGYQTVHEYRTGLEPVQQQKKTLSTTLQLPDGYLYWQGHTTGSSMTRPALLTGINYLLFIYCQII